MNIYCPSSKEVKNQTFSDEIKFKLAACFKIKKLIFKSPKKQRISLQKSHFPLENVKIIPYFDNSCDYLLFLTKFNKSTKPVALLINENLRMFQIEIYAPLNMFTNTLFDGFLTAKNDFFEFFVYDIYYLNNKSLFSCQYEERFNILTTCFPSVNEWNSTCINDVIGTNLAQTGQIVCVPNEEPKLFMYTPSYFDMNEISLILNKYSNFIFKSNEDELFFQKKPSVLLFFNKEHQFQCLLDDQLAILQDMFPITQFNFNYPQMNMPCGIVEMTVNEVEGDLTFIFDYVKHREDQQLPHQNFFIEGVLQQVMDKISFKMISKTK